MGSRDNKPFVILTREGKTLFHAGSVHRFTTKQDAWDYIDTQTPPGAPHSVVDERSRAIEIFKPRS